MQAVHTEDDKISGLPRRDTTKECTGCLNCAAICPGLAITLVEFRKDKEFPTVTLPYEVWRKTVEIGKKVPVTVEEYKSRQDRYDGQLVDKCHIDITGKSIEEKVALLRKYREEQYEKPQDTVYKRRGWTPDGIPTVATVKRLGIDFPEALEILKANGVQI